MTLPAAPTGDAELEAALKKKLTPEFLETLVQAARTVGWGADYVEVSVFVETLHEMAGLGFEMPDVFEK